MKKKHLCKLCKKNFLNGKLLKGHMRIHLEENPVKGGLKIEDGGRGSDGYVLRENPKKSRRFSGPNHSNNTKPSFSVQQNIECKVCGRDFESPRSLYGHMRHHSRDERKGVRCNECGKGFRSLRALTGHMRLHSKKLGVSSELGPDSVSNIGLLSLPDSETVNLVRRKRSNRKRCKINPNSSFSGMNESVSTLEIDQELEEVAICLLMLSKGEREWSEFHAVSESLDETFEVKSMNQNKRIRSEDEGDLYDGNEIFQKQEPIEMLLYPPCPSDLKKENADFSEGDSKMVWNVEMKIAELEVHSTKAEVGDESGFVSLSPDKIECDFNEAEPRENLIEVGLDLADWELVKSSPRSEFSCDDSDAVTRKQYNEDLVLSSTSSGIVDDSSKRNEFKCRICSKTFLSYQALGGHQTSHRIPKSCTTSKTDDCQKNLDSNGLPDTIVLPEIQLTRKLESCENSVVLETDGATATGDDESKKTSRDYRCHICFKNFVSGQALGGHKRAHLIKTREEPAATLKQDASHSSDVFDVNLPDMLVADHSNSDVGFNSWWVQSSCNHEPLVSLVAN